MKELRLSECLNDFEGLRFIEVKFQLYNEGYQYPMCAFTKYACRTANLAI